VTRVTQKRGNDQEIEFQEIKFQEIVFQEIVFQEIVFQEIEFQEIEFHEIEIGFYHEIKTIAKLIWRSKVFLNKI
jgi:hypothetical protein